MKRSLLFSVATAVLFVSVVVLVAAAVPADIAGSDRGFAVPAVLCRFRSTRVGREELGCAAAIVQMHVAVESVLERIAAQQAELIGSEHVTVTVSLAQHHRELADELWLRLRAGEEELPSSLLDGAVEKFAKRKKMRFRGQITRKYHFLVDDHLHMTGSFDDERKQARVDVGETYDSLGSFDEAVGALSVRAFYDCAVDQGAPHSIGFWASSNITLSWRVLRDPKQQSEKDVCLKSILSSIL